MSVMILRDEVFMKVAATLSYYQVYGRHYTLQAAINKNLNGRCTVNEFIKKLRHLNYKSYNERYDDSLEVPEITFSESMPVDMFQLHKYLDAVNYQIDTDHKYIIYLDNILDAIRRQILYSLPQYEAAEWG